MEIKVIKIEKPADLNFIFGQSHFIKTVEDLHEALVAAVPGIEFGVAFCEASGPCLIRTSGNSEELEKLAEKNALAVGAGHSFLIFLKGAYPVNVLNRIKMVDEVVSIYCATANNVTVIIGEEGEGRAVLGVIDGESPRGSEGPEEKTERKAFLRKIGYKL